MKALLIKDFYVLTKNLKMFLLVIIVLSLINDPAVSSIAVTYGVMLPIAAISYDERSHFAKLSRALPFSSFEITITKYLIGYFCLFFSIGLSYLTNFIFVNRNELSPSDWALRVSNFNDILLLGICVGGVMLAVLIPVMFRFGAEKGRLYFILGVFCISLIGNMLINEFNYTAIYNSMKINSFLIVLFIMVLNIISIIFAVKINKRKLS